MQAGSLLHGKNAAGFARAAKDRFVFCLASAFGKGYTIFMKGL